MTEPTEDVVLQISSPHILPAEGGAAGAGGGRGAAELGRRLLAAARGGHTGAVLELMARGAPFTADWLGTSALHLAAAGAHLDTCAVLLRAGVSRDARTKVERTPLHLAAHAGHAPAAALLLRHGAAPDARDMLRMTPLHWAAERGHRDVAATLLRHGADPAALTKFGKTPRRLAEARGHADVAALLREAEEARDAAPEDAGVPPAEQRRALHSIRPERDDEPEAPPQRDEDVERPREPDAQVRTDEEGAAGEAGPAAALLRRHGIALLPRDDGSTVLNAIQSGRTVVLSDAGKLMLKESVGGGNKMVLTATPVREPPRAGVKIFTLNNSNLAVEPRAPAPAPLKPAPAAAAPGVRAQPLKAKARGAARPAVKIIMHKASFDKMLSGGGAGAGPGAELAAARAAVARLTREVEALKARLARYEPV